MFTGNIVRFINCTPPFMTTTPLLNASEDQPMSKLVIYACSCFWLLLFSGGCSGVHCRGSRESRGCDEEKERTRQNDFLGICSMTNHIMFTLALVVQKVDNAIQCINLFPLDNAIIYCFP